MKSSLWGCGDSTGRRDDVSGDTYWTTSANWMPTHILDSSSKLGLGGFVSLELTG